MTYAEIAAENDRIMGHLSICHSCAKDNGGRMAEYVAVTTWVGTCKICLRVKDCYHMRDFGLNPKRFCKPDIAVGS